MAADRGIFVVADGMGGHAAGEVASEMAVRFVARELGSLRGLSDDQVADRMRTAIRAANGAIFQRTLTEHDRSHPYSNVITRCVGANSDVMPDIYLGTVKPKDLFLLASDGLTGMLEDHQLAELLTASRMPQEQVDELVTEANRHGGLDNTSSCGSITSSTIAFAFTVALPSTNTRSRRAER